MSESYFLSPVTNNEAARQFAGNSTFGSLRLAACAQTSKAAEQIFYKPISWAVARLNLTHAYRRIGSLRALIQKYLDNARQAWIVLDEI